MSDGLKLDPFALWANTSQRLHFHKPVMATQDTAAACVAVQLSCGIGIFRLWLVSAFYIAPIQSGNVTPGQRYQTSVKSKNRVKWTNPKTNITFLHTSLDVKMFAQGRCSRTCRIDSDHGARRCLTWHKSHSELPSGRWSISIVKFKPSGYSMGQI